MKTNQNMLQDKVISELNMRKTIFEKCVAKKKAVNNKIEVEIAIDNSGSMPSLYRNGTIQTIIEALFPFASYYNENQELSLCTFSDDVKIQIPVSEDNLYNYTIDEIIMNQTLTVCGSRNFFPVMSYILEKHNKINIPSCSRLVFLITNGDAYDKDSYRKLLINNVKANLFWQFINLETNWQQNFIQDNQISEQCVNNIGFLRFPMDSPVFSEKLYDLILNKFLLWEKEARIKGIISKDSHVA